MPLPGRVFISYSHTDRPYVEKLARHLEAVGIPVWYDVELSAGERFSDVIQEQVRGCSAFVVVLTPRACKSRYVPLELEFAFEQGKAILPLLLEPCDRPFHTIGLHHEDVRTGRLPTERFVTDLRAAVAASASAKAAPAKKKPAVATPPSDIDRITAELTNALRNRNPLPLATAVDVIRKTAPGLAAKHGGSGKWVAFVQKRLTAFGFDPRDGGWLWLASGPKPAIPVAAVKTPPAPARAAKKATATAGAPVRRPAVPPPTKMLPVIPASRTPPDRLAPPRAAARRRAEPTWWATVLDRLRGAMLG